MPDKPFTFRVKMDDPLYKKITDDIEKSGKNTQPFLIDHFKAHYGLGESGEVSKDSALVSSPASDKSLVLDPASMNETSLPLETGSEMVTRILNEELIPKQSFIPRCSHCQYNNDCMREQHGEEGRLFQQCHSFRDTNVHQIQRWVDCNYGVIISETLRRCHKGKDDAKGIPTHTPTSIEIKDKRDCESCWNAEHMRWELHKELRQSEKMVKDNEQHGEGKTDEEWNTFATKINRPYDPLSTFQRKDPTYTGNRSPAPAKLPEEIHPSYREPLPLRTLRNQVVKCPKSSPLETFQKTVRLEDCANCAGYLTCPKIETFVKGSMNVRK